MVSVNKMRRFTLMPVVVTVTRISPTRPSAAFAACRALTENSRSRAADASLHVHFRLSSHVHRPADVQARRRSVHSDWTYTLKHYKIWVRVCWMVRRGVFKQSRRMEVLS